jgi:hypothetical protein
MNPDVFFTHLTDGGSIKEYICCMINLNFNDSVFFGLNDSSCGIELNEDNRIISYVGGLTNSTNFVVPVQSATSGTINATNDSYIFLLSPTSGFRGGGINLFLPANPPQGKMIIIKRGNLLDLEADPFVGILTVNGNSKNIRLVSTSSVATFNLPATFSSATENYYNAHLLFSNDIWWLVKYGGSDKFISGGA